MRPVLRASYTTTRDVTVIQEAYVHGISTRSVDDLVRAMGMEGISRSQVSRLCADIDERVREFLLASPRLFADETTMPVLDPGRGEEDASQPWATMSS